MLRRPILSVLRTNVGIAATTHLFLQRHCSSTAASSGGGSNDKNNNSKDKQTAAPQETKAATTEAADTASSSSSSWFSLNSIHSALENNTSSTDKNKQQEQQQPADGSSATTKKSSLLDRWHAEQDKAVEEGKQMADKMKNAAVDKFGAVTPGDPETEKQEAEDRKKAERNGALFGGALILFLGGMWYFDSYLPSKKRAALNRESGVFFRPTGSGIDGNDTAAGEPLIVREQLAASPLDDDDLDKLWKWAKAHGCDYAAETGTCFSRSGTVHDPYFNTESVYRVSGSGVALEVQVATYALWNMMLEIVQEACEDPAVMERFGFADWLKPHIVNSWYQSQQQGGNLEMDTIARFDFILDEEKGGTPVMLEVNAQTPTVMVEAATLQREWKTEKVVGALDPVVTRLPEAGCPNDKIVAPRSSQPLHEMPQCNYIEHAIMNTYRRQIAACPAMRHDNVYFAMEPWGSDVELNNTLQFMSRMFVRSLDATQGMLKSLIGTKYGNMAMLGVRQLEQILEGKGDVSLDTGGGNNNNSKSVIHHDRTRSSWVHCWYPYEALFGETASNVVFEQMCKDLEDPQAAVIAASDAAITSGGASKPRVFMKEPLWRMLVSSKAMLPLLYERFPECTYLRPAFFLDDVVNSRSNNNNNSSNNITDLVKQQELKRIMEDGAGLVAKPGLGREGVGVLVSHDHPFVLDKKRHLNKLKERFRPGSVAGTSLDAFLSSATAAQKAYHAENSKISVGSVVTDPYILQAYVDSPRVSGRQFIIGSWCIGGQPSGIGIREDLEGNVTKDHSSFVPHVIEQSSSSKSVMDVLYADDSKAAELWALMSPSALAAGIRANLYGQESIDMDMSRIDFPQSPPAGLEPAPATNEQRRRRHHPRFGGGGWWGGWGGSDNSNNADKKGEKAGKTGAQNRSGFSSSSRRAAPPPVSPATRSGSSSGSSSSSRPSPTHSSSKVGFSSSRPAPKSTGSVFKSSSHAHSRVSGRFGG